MNLKKNNVGKIFIQILPLFVFITLSFSYLIYQRQSNSYTGAACGYTDSNNTNFFKPCSNTNQCIQETCIGASSDQPRSRGTCQFSGYRLTPPSEFGTTWQEYNAAHPVMPIGYYCACVGDHYRNGRCEPYLGENYDTAPMDCSDGTCPEGVSPPRRLEGTGFCSDRLIPVVCNANTPSSTVADGCCPTATAYAAGDPDCCPPPVNSNSCGNGTVDSGETCDYNTAKPSGFNGNGLDLTPPTTGSCRLNTANGACSYCGDGIVQTIASEQCDPAQTTSSCSAGQTCNEGCQCKPSTPTNTNTPNSNVPENSNETPTNTNDTPSVGNTNTANPAVSLPSDNLQGSGGCSLAI